MGNSHSLNSPICSCCCCCCCCCCSSSKAIDDTKLEEKSIKITATNYSYREIDLDVLAAKISEVLEKAKAKESSSSKKSGKSRWKSPKSEDVSQLEDFVCDFNQCSEDLRRVTRGDYGTEYMGAVQNMLMEVGKVHWVAFGLLLVGMTLQRFDRVSENQEECMDVLDEMFRLCAYLTEIREMESLRDNMGDLFEKSIQLVVEGTILCTSHNESSSFFRFLRADEQENRLQAIRRDIDKVHTHLMLQMSFYTVQNLNKRGNRLPRQQFYPLHAVGIEHAVEQVTNTLELDSEKNVLVVLLHGFGGTGKTTLADAVFASINNSNFTFSKVSLFENIDSVPSITQVQKDILDDICSIGEYEKPKSYTEGQNALSKVLKEKRCFLYIDNVLDREELRKLLPKNLVDCKKLRIMMTARDSVVVDALRVGNQNIQVYEVPSLQKEASMALLCASMNAKSLSDCVDLTQLEYILKMCGGVPLVLEIVGCYIGNEHDKDAAFRIIKEGYENSGGERLALAKVEFFAFTFDTIEEAFKDAFLDICAFFVGCRWNVVGRILGEEVLQLLERRALIKKQQVDWQQRVSSFWKCEAEVQIHDFILEIGRKRCKGNRVTNLSELRALLSADEDTFKSVKGILLQESLDEQIELLKGETLQISAEQLDILSSSLRIFSTGSRDTFFAAMEISGTCKASFDKLVFWDSPKAEPPFLVNRCFELRDLDYAPSKAVTLSELPKSLRHLSIRLVNIEDASQPIQLYAGEGEVLPNIKSMTLTIDEVADSMFILPPKLLLPLKTIRELFIRDFAMEILSDDFHHLEQLTLLCVERSRNLKQFPDNFGKCNSLKILLISECPRLEDLPEKLYNLPVLESLKVMRCQSLKRLPKKIGECTPLKMLSVEYCAELEELPESFANLPSLEAIRIENCEQFKCLPTNFWKLSALQSLNLTGCKNLQQLCQVFHCLPSLKEIILNGCTTLENGCLEDLVKIKSLQVVHIKDSPQLIIKWQQMKSTYCGKLKVVY